MKTDSTQDNRRTTRWTGYDYTSCGAYFVTICTHEKRCVFGRVLDGAMVLNVYGEMVRDCWLETPQHFPNVEVDEWVVMPNHFHAILIISDDCRGLARQAPTCQTHTSTPRFSQPQSGSLGTIIGAFKSAVTRRINQYRAELDLAPVRVWQRNYYDRVIRNEKEWLDTRRYIIENPVNWANDENHP